MTVADTEVYCRGGPSWFADWEGNCYRLVSVSSGEELRTACRSVGAPLAVINTPTADNKIRYIRNHAHGIYSGYTSWIMYGMYVY